jgi:putative restriction endonuclease
VKAYVGVTDGDWYRFLAARPLLQEVNFWQPSGDRQFRVLAIGEPFLFKSHYPQNRVVGGGFYSGFAQLPISEAWELFGEANGVSSLNEMRRRVGRYRRRPIGPAEDPVIGCIFIRDTRFFASDAYADPPPNFAPNVVQGKSYVLEQEASYFEGLLRRILDTAIEADVGETWHRPGPVNIHPLLGWVSDTPGAEMSSCGELLAV